MRSETEIAFAGLCDLLRPAMSSLSALPAPQADALRGALALGPPVPGDRFAVCVSALGLLRALASERPVLVAVDDAPWLDAPTREVLGYAARRHGGGVGFVLAAREDDLDPFELEDLPVLGVGPLDDDSARRLLERGGTLASWVRDTVVEAASGNPLALVELPVELGSEQRRGVEVLPRPLVPGARLRAAYERRVRELSDETQRVLILAAIHEEDDLGPVARAAEAAGLDPDVLVAAEDTGLLTLSGGRFAFRHPLMRGVIVAIATPAEQRAAHRSLAGVLAGERRAWHLGSASYLPDETVAAELESAAGAAVARRGYASAAAALHRAAELSTTPGDRGRRLLAAGQAAAAAGRPSRAATLLEGALAQVEDPDLRSQIIHLQAGVKTWSGDAWQAIELLESGAAQARSTVLAARMLADAAAACTAVNQYARAEAVVERAVAILDGEVDRVAWAHVTAVHAYVHALRGHMERARAGLRAIDEVVVGVDKLVAGNTWVHLMERTRAPTGDTRGALDRALDVCARAREAGAMSPLVGSLVVAGDAALRLGLWDLADEVTEEAADVARDTEQHLWRGMALTARARLLAARGKEEQARWLLETARHIAEQCGLVSDTASSTGRSASLSSASTASMKQCEPSSGWRRWRWDPGCARRQSFRGSPTSWRPTCDRAASATLHFWSPDSMRTSWRRHLPPARCSHAATGWWRTTSTSTSWRPRGSTHSRPRRSNERGQCWHGAGDYTGRGVGSLHVPASSRPWRASTS